MYSTPLDIASSRILASHRPLIYQWALHIISGLSFIHAHNVVFGDLDLEQCWLSLNSHLSLSLVGFVHAGFWRSTDGAWYDGRQSNAAWFPPLEHTKASTQTDLFLYGCVVYQLMTGAWPGDRLTDKTGPEIRMMITRKEWPLLETEHMGEIVRRCWTGGFADAKQLKAEVVAFLEALGWRIEGDDDLHGVDVTRLSFNVRVQR
jgi:serine/threonine protein kinase